MKPPIQLSEEAVKQVVRGQIIAMLWFAAAFFNLIGLVLSLSLKNWWLLPVHVLAVIACGVALKDRLS